MISGFNGKGLMFGNMKGGVGKSTLCMYTLEMLQRLKPKLDILLIDTDPQASSSTMMTKIMPMDRVRAMPMGDGYDGAIMSTVDGIVKSHLVKDDSMVVVDAAAGKIGNVWQVAVMCNAIIVPTSLSWTDLQPTIAYIEELDARKDDYGTINPHLIVVPNRTSPQQRDYSYLTDAVNDLNVVLAPPVSDFAIVKQSSHGFKGLVDVEGSRYYDEIHGLATFIVSHVLSGKLDKIFEKES